MIRNSDLDITTGIPGSSYTTFSGQPVTPDDVLVKYTYIGDANLNGAVSFDDYVGMDNAFFELIPNLGWATGDINFDGVINFDDYSKVDQAFFFQGAAVERRRKRGRRSRAGNLAADAAHFRGAGGLRCGRTPLGTRKPKNNHSVRPSGGYKPVTVSNADRLIQEKGTHSFEVHQIAARDLFDFSSRLDSVG